LSDVFGFRSGRNSVHTSRTMMLAELTALLGATRADSAPDAYWSACIEDNVLSKRTPVTRRTTADQLRELYALDPGVTVFRLLRQFWSADLKARPLLACLCAQARDPLFRATADFVLTTKAGRACHRRCPAPARGRPGGRAVRREDAPLRRAEPRVLVDAIGVRAVRAGEEELFKARAKEKGSVKIIDIIAARLDAKTDSYLAELPSLRLKDARISPKLVSDNERMLTGGFYAEIELTYDAEIAQENSGRPFGIESLRPIQLSKRDVLDALYRGRELFTTGEWKRFLIRSVGLEPDALTPRAQDIMLLRMVPFVERNYNAVELGRAAPARATCSSRCRRTRTWSLVARRRWRECS
jgi:hypothetical protein